MMALKYIPRFRAMLKSNPAKFDAIAEVCRRANTIGRNSTDSVYKASEMIKGRALKVSGMKRRRARRRLAALHHELNHLRKIAPPF